MQIFWLHEDPATNARHYSDRHVNKIILEIAQCVSTALREKGYEDDEIYGKTHTGHSIIEWIKESSDNLVKAISMAQQLNREFKYRDPARSDHKSWLVLDQIELDRATQLYNNHMSTTPPQAIRSDLVRKEADSIHEVVTAYREYYLKEKLVWSDGKVARWTRRGRPKWITEAMKDPFTETQIDYSGLNT